MIKSVKQYPNINCDTLPHFDWPIRLLSNKCIDIIITIQYQLGSMNLESTSTLSLTNDYFCHSC